MKKSITSILLLISISSFSQKYSPETLMTDFLSGRLFIINGLAIGDTDSSFFTTLSKTEIISYEYLDSLEGKENYGTLGERGVIRLNIKKLKKLKKKYASLLDASILKHFNQEDSLFYHTNGVPNNNIYYAVNSIVNMKIEKIQILDKYQAEALWGKEGKNGAIVINCNRDEKLVISE